MTNFYNIFSTPPLMSNQYHCNDIDTILNYAENINYNFGISNYQSSNKFILNEPLFDNLKKFFEECLVKYIHKVFDCDHKFVITQSWINKSKKRKYHHNHLHQNSLISGVFYIQCDENSGEIVFDRGNPYFNMQINHLCANEYISEQYYYLPRVGELLLFPSNLMHSVKVNESNNDRISLSFNSFPTLPVGNVDQATYLF